MIFYKDITVKVIQDYIEELNEQMLRNHLNKMGVFSLILILDSLKSIIPNKDDDSIQMMSNRVLGELFFFVSSNNKRPKFDFWCSYWSEIRLGKTNKKQVKERFIEFLIYINEITATLPHKTVKKILTTK